MPARKEINFSTDKNGCHICTSHYKIDGYPHFYRKEYGNIKIVRYLWFEKYGFLTRKQMLLHSCDNPACINLAHIRVGSAKDNTNDAKKRGRLAFGTRNGATRLTDNQAREIKYSQETEVVLAEKYNINRATVGYIRRGETWTHIL